MLSGGDRGACGLQEANAKLKPAEECPESSSNRGGKAQSLRMQTLEMDVRAHDLASPLSSGT